MFAIRSWIRCGINRTDSESFEICAASRSTARSHVQKRLKTMFFCFIFGGLIYLDMRGMYGVCHVKLVWSGTQLYWFRIFSYMFLHFLTCSYSFLYFPSWETHILCWMGHSVFFFSPTSMVTTIRPPASRPSLIGCGKPHGEIQSENDLQMWMFHIDVSLQEGTHKTIYHLYMCSKKGY